MTPLHETKQKNSLNKNLLFSASGILISRIIGFLRSIFETAMLGIGANCDSYQAAFRLTNFFRELFGEGGLSGAFTPLYARIEKEEDLESAFTFFWITVFLTFFSSFLITLFLLFFSTPIFSLWLSGFSNENLQLAKNSFFFMVPYLCLIATASVFMLSHHLHNLYFLSSLHPILFSLSIIIFAITDPLKSPIHSLSLGISIGGLLQILVLAIFSPIPFTFHIARIKPLIPRVKKMIFLLFPVIFAASVQKLNKLIDLNFASSLVSGSLSALSYATVIINVPLGIIAVAASNVYFPKISRLYSKYDTQKKQELIIQALFFLSLAGFPFAFHLMIQSQEISQFLFLKIPNILGVATKMDDKGCTLLAQSLQFYAPGLLFSLFIPLLIRLHQADLDTRTPAAIGFISVVVNLVLNIFLTPVLQHKGIALSTSISFALQFLLLFSLLKIPFAFFSRSTLLFLIIFCVPIAIWSTISWFFSGFFYPLQFFIGSFIYFLFFIVLKWKSGVFFFQNDFTPDLPQS